MKKVFLFAALAAVITVAGCGKEEEPPTPRIDGLTLDNFPIMDGSTSTDPLVRTIACELLGYGYQWRQPDQLVTWEISTMLPESFVKDKIRCSQTHGSITALIEGQSFLTGIAGPDIVFSARRMSADEKEWAKTHNVSIIETPVALDALVFIVPEGGNGHHANGGVNSLTHAQIESIYTAKTKNWNEVGGMDMPIVPFIRNKNSGSQELMESLVMSEPIPDGFWEDHYDDFQPVSGMYPLLTSVGSTDGGLGYTVYYYLTQIVRGGNINALKELAVDGVVPDKASIANRSYPFTAEVYMMIRSDLDRQSAAYKVYEYMQTAAGQGIVAKSGYVPVN